MTSTHTPGARPPLHRAPSTCPVCTGELITLRLGCPECGTEVSGGFTSCAFCRLGRDDLDMLGVFLRSRGNMRDVQAHLGVSYPTARQRFAELLQRLGLDGDDGGKNDLDETAILADVAAGRLSPAAAARLLENDS